MQIKRLAALSLAAILATTMLTACPWDKEGGNSVDDSQITADENRPGHTGSDDNDDSDDTSDDDDSKVTITEDENGNKIEKGDGYTRTETPATGSSDGKISYTVTNAAGLVKWASEAPAERPFSVDCTLLEDIDMAGYSWTPVCPDSSYPYMGTFDGNGKCIENLHVESNDNGGLFAYVGPDGCVKNLTLNNATISGGAYTGGIVGSILLSSQSETFSFHSCYWSGQPEKVATILAATDEGYQPAPDNYTGAYKIGKQEDGSEVTWGDAVTAMNSALSGYECSYTANGNNPPTLNTGTGSAANQLAGRLGLSWPF